MNTEFSTPGPIMIAGSPIMRWLDGALFGEHPGWPLRPIILWLLTDGRVMTSPDAVLDGLTRRLEQVGAPIARIRISCATLHPQVAAWGALWSRGKGAAPWQIGHQQEIDAGYVDSPVQYVRETGKPFRRRLEGLDPTRDHRLMFELQAAGCTDYFGCPLPFSGERTNFFGIACDRPNGFTDDDLTKFGVIGLALAPVLEVIEARRTAVTLLNTYVGVAAGERVLQGLIRRGDGETVRAAFWYSDLRNFTGLTEALPPGRLLALLNTYFELVAGPLQSRGGEILQFIGDAILDMFRAPSDIPIEAATARVCRAAADSAAEIFEAIGAANRGRIAAGEPPIRFGVGLEVGDVIHGNVGAPDRLGINVVGPAVNRAARLESLTKRLGRSVLMSADFAAFIEQRREPMGRHALRGMDEETEVYALSLPDADD